MTAKSGCNQGPNAYAVMGNPIAHSKSPLIHDGFARQTGQHIIYTAIKVDPGDFVRAVGDFRAHGGKGLNVTVPFKVEAWTLVDERSSRAERAGAVNTIQIRPDMSLYGDNTDGVGLVRDIIDKQGECIKDQRVLILGAGGAVRGVLAPLLEERPAQLIVANRTIDRAVQLAEEYGTLGTVRGCGLADLQGLHFDLVINGTSASLKGDLPLLPDGILADAAWCYDMMYGSKAEVFLRWGKRQGARKVTDGLGMLVEQAAESFFLWRGVRPDTGPVFEALRDEMGRPGWE